MLVKEDLEKRVAEIQAAIDQSVSNHNVLIGHITEAKFLLEKFNVEELEEEKKPEPESFDHAP